MFKKRAIFLFLFVTALLVFVLHEKGFFAVSEKRVQEYVNLILRTKGIAEEASSEPFAMRQKREGVSKTLFLSESSGRRAVRLKSDTSELFATNVSGNYQVLERFKGVHCDSQESNYYRLPSGEESPALVPGAILMQRVRHIDAEEASYDYNKDLLSAEKVHFIRFSTEGDALREKWGEVKPSMVGDAETFFFTLVEHEPSFKASHIRLTITGEEALPK